MICSRIGLGLQKQKRKEVDYLRKTIIQVTILVAVLAALALGTASMAFAADGGTLQLKKESPPRGSTNVPVQNVGFKLYFDGNVTDPNVWGVNQKMFTLTDSNKKSIPIQAVAGVKENDYILVVANPASTGGVPGSLASNSKYTLTIKEGLMDVNGRTLGEPETISFTTLDMAANSRISMFLMIGMMVAVIALMVFTNARKMRAEAEAAALLKANPYKIAKERGVTVKEAEELIAKAKEKNRIKLEKSGGKAPVPEAEKAKQNAVPQLGAGKKQKPKKRTWKVSGPRPASAGGSAYVKRRKAEAEAKAKAEAAKKAARARQQSGGSGKKSTKGKGKKK